jgi:hypothetical protein
MATFCQIKHLGSTDMTRTILIPALMIALIAGTTAPAFAQNRFMDEARDAANRRAENKAVREAEHPAEEAAPAKPAATASTATPAPAETAPAAQSAAPAAPAAPAK